MLDRLVLSRPAFAMATRRLDDPAPVWRMNHMRRESGFATRFAGVSNSPTYLIWILKTKGVGVGGKWGMGVRSGAVRGGR